MGDEILSSSESKSVEEIRQNFAIDWRVKKPFFDDQISHFCMKDEMADVEFVFNRQNKITVCFSYIKAIYFFTYLEDSSPQICTFCRLRSFPKRTRI